MCLFNRKEKNKSGKGLKEIDILSKILDGESKKSGCVKGMKLVV